MRFYILLAASIVALTFGTSTCAFAQYDSGGLSTAAELLQIRRAVNVYVDHIAGYHYRSKDILWDLTEVTRDDFDDKPGLEAQVHIWGDGLCGASACDNAIVVWRNGRAKVIAVVNDSILSVSSTKSHGMYDLLGHYYYYRWDGKSYVSYCERGSDTVCERERLSKESGKQ